ncbi:hypothetical protein [Pedobacter xixiisoli]|uniref:Uncharacterized protein n=1 Tax=Pedobacter xixiisoli TaxID=1476464 RepID=A0A285ZQA1_9SPHI|nr:hypothetical protein [Pedobacter xixiisoli]SOD11831.1 hypothetical protein SAMN06297358_0355 [Pedobacter xixiisoli]
MEPFEINLVGQTLTIQPRLDGAYDVFEGSELLGAIHPVSSDGQTNWTSEELDVDYAKQIGELIDEYKL